MNWKGEVLGGRMAGWKVCRMFAGISGKIITPNPGGHGSHTSKMLNSVSIYGITM